MTEVELTLLRPAVLAMPVITRIYNEATRKVENYGTFCDLERHILADLVSGDPNRVRNGMANVFRWGVVNGNYAQLRQHILALGNATAGDEYVLAARLFPILQQQRRTPCLGVIKGLYVPGYSGVSYISKLRMFLSPDRYVVLDRVLLNKLRNPADTNTRNILDKALFDNERDSQIQVNKRNELVYERWSAFCRQVVAWHFTGVQMHNRPVCAADVERGFYALVNASLNQVNAARTILNTHAPI